LAEAQVAVEEGESAPEPTAAGTKSAPFSASRIADHLKGKK
jgi:hypothetical protein